MQGVGSQSGLVIDDFTLQKPANWRPSPGARLGVINQGFQSNHTDTFIEVRSKRPISQHASLPRRLLPGFAQRVPGFQPPPSAYRASMMTL